MQGRPKDGPEDKFRLTPVVPRLQELLGVKVGNSESKRSSCEHNNQMGLSTRSKGIVNRLEFYVCKVDRLLLTQIILGSSGKTKISSPSC